MDRRPSCGKVNHTIVIGRRNPVGPIGDIARHRLDFRIRPVVFKLLNPSAMRISALRALRIAVLAFVFAVVLGEYLVPGITARIFKSGSESSQKSPAKSGHQSATLRA
jgi:hypothetical protein